MNDHSFFFYFFIFFVLGACTQTTTLKSKHTSIVNKKNNFTSNSENKGETFRLFKDFDEISLQGIDEISDAEKILPYVELHYDETNTLKYFRAYHSNGKTYERFYQKRLDVLSTHHTSPMSRGVRSHNFTFFTTQNQHIVFSYDENPYEKEKVFLSSIILVDKENEEKLIKKVYYINNDSYGKPTTLNIEAFFSELEIDRQPDVVFTITSSEEEECHIEEHFSDGETTFTSDEPYCVDMKGTTTFWKHLERYARIDLYEKN